MAINEIQSKVYNPAKPLRAFWLAALAILALRIVSLWFNNAQLFFDEAQYWAWAKEPAFGYFSKPPMLAWLIGAFTAVCGDSEFCVRLPSPILHTLTAFLLFLTARQLFDGRTAFWTGLIWLTLPAVSLSSTLISTDVPLLLFWSASLYALVRLERDDTIAWALALGTAIGLGLLSKYAMAYFVLCAVAYSLAVSDRPHLIKRSTFWLAILLGLLLLMPNIWWNIENRFVTVGHTGENIGWGRGGLHFDRLGEFFGSQFGVFGPILFGVYLVAVFRLFREGMVRQQALLLAFSLPVLLLICFQALMSKAYANWAATAFPAATILLADLLVNHMPAPWNRVSMTIHAIIFAVIAVAVCFAAPGQLPMPDQSNPFKRLWGARELARQLTVELEKGGYSHVLSDNRRKSATLIYYLRDLPERVIAWRRGAPRDHFQLTRALSDMDPDAQRAAVFLYPGATDNIASPIADLFERVQKLPGGEEGAVLYRLEGYRQ